MTKFHKTTLTFIKGAKTLPGKYYTSAALFIEEIDRIFYSRWLCIGRVEQIPHPGDYFIQQVGTESIIVVRDEKGEVQAFYNLCRHRGTRLCTEAQGNFNGKILCPYHAWGYGLDGRLELAPLMNELDDFNQQDYPLHSVAVATWKNFLFLNLAESPEPFATAFAPLYDKFAQWELSKLRVSDRIIYDIQANWKLIFQNYSECYHCPTLHPDYVMVHRIWPRSPSRTQVICEWLFDPEAMKQADFNPQDAVQFWDMTNRQDWEVCELMQTGVSSRAYTPGPYSSAESLLAQFDREYLKAIEH